MSKKLTRFQISGLFNQFDVNLDLNTDVNIFIGENGMGKTKIMNCLNYSLKRDFSNLKDIKFEKITITFEDEVATLRKEDMLAYLLAEEGNVRKSSVSKIIKNIISVDEISKFKEKSADDSIITQV